MQTVEISNAVYNNIMSRRIGNESISQTIERELKPIDTRRAELEQLKNGKFYKLSEI